MVASHDVAKWLMDHNPSLASGYLDENVRLNQLLYFSNLMYYCVTQENMIDEDFVASKQGPLVLGVCRDYQNKKITQKQNIQDPIVKQVLNIINFVYGYASKQAIIKELKGHAIWKEQQYQLASYPKLHFENVEEDLVDYFKGLYQAYDGFDFSNIKSEKINGNVYFYFQDAFEMTDEIVDWLFTLDHDDNPKFLENKNGKIVIY